MKEGELSVSLQDENETVRWGKAIGEALKGGGIVYLLGELGAGKTTLCRGILRSFGYRAAVKSPTYTIIEPYEFDDENVYHFDLYRMTDPQEWDYLGFNDYFHPPNICLVEWPQKANGWLPICDINITLEYVGVQRKVIITAKSKRGFDILSAIRKKSAK